MRYLIIIIFFIFTTNLSAQKKLSVDLSLGVLKSVGRDLNSTYKSNNYPLTIYYPSRHKFENPFLNIFIQGSYPLNRRMSVGLQSGLYVHFAEKFLTNVKYTKASVPVLANFSYKLFDINSNDLGISISGGKLFYSIDESVIKAKNASIYNLSAFYNVSNKSFIKLGIEKQNDNVIITPDETEYPREKYKYHLKRFSLFLTYGFKIGK